MGHVSVLEKVTAWEQRLHTTVGQKVSPCDPCVKWSVKGGLLQGEEGLVPARMYIPQFLRYFDVQVKTVKYPSRFDFHKG